MAKEDEEEEGEIEEEEEEGKFSRRKLIIESTKFAEFVSTPGILGNKDPRPLVLHGSLAGEYFSLLSRREVCLTKCFIRLTRKAKYPSSQGSLGFQCWVSTAVSKNIDVIGVI